MPVARPAGYGPPPVPHSSSRRHRSSRRRRGGLGRKLVFMLLFLVLVGGALAGGWYGMQMLNPPQTIVVKKKKTATEEVAKVDTAKETKPEPKEETKKEEEPKVVDPPTKKEETKVTPEPKVVPKTEPKAMPKEKEPPKIDGPLVFFDKHIQPLMEKHCVRCHGEGGKKFDGKFDARTIAGINKGGESGKGTAIVAGMPAKSLLWELVRENDMPPKEDGGKLTDAEKKLIEDWIKGGAKASAAVAAN